MMEVVVTAGTINRAKLQSNHLCKMLSLTVTYRRGGVWPTLAVLPCRILQL